MSNVTSEAAPAGEPPFELPPLQRAWYRRRAVVVGAAVAIVLAITVVSDLPQHTSVPQQIQQETTVIQAIHNDANSCLYAASEAFHFYDEETKGTLSSANRADLPGFLTDDQGACSFTNNSIFDLSNIEVPGSAAGNDIGEVVNTVTLWVTSDALAAIEAIMTLTKDPTNTAALSALSSAERLLASDRRAVTHEIGAADKALGGASLPGIGLPSLPAPSASKS
jgi:hypothetical protein